MTEFPFSADQIQKHRFHGVIQGNLELEEGALRLRTTYGLIRLYPRAGKGGGRVFRAAYAQQSNHPDTTINAYGYPRTDKDGIVRRFELISWFTEGSTPPEDYKGIGRKFSPGQIFLCGRVRRLEEGMVTVKVKSVVAEKEFRWLVTGRLAGKDPAIGSKVLFAGGLDADGQLIVRPLQELTPPGKPTAPRPSRVAPRGSSSRGWKLSPDSTGSPSRNSAGTPLSTSLSSRVISSADSADQTLRRIPPEPSRRQQPELTRNQPRRPAALQRPQR